MSELPKVLCGGFARSGTSFLCNLIDTLGFSPGERGKLKKGEASNPRGYWEFLPIRKLSWKAIGVNHTLWQHRVHTMPDRPPRLENHPNAAKIRKMARKYKVAVYKDNYLPLVYTLFPATSKIVFIKRDYQDIYASTMRIRQHPETLEDYKHAIEKFYKLARLMAKERECLFVNYEQFRDDFDVATRAVADFLGVRQYDARKTRAIWVPNPKR